jgi:hypothetical protein
MANVVRHARQVTFQTAAGHSLVPPHHAQHLPRTKLLDQFFHLLSLEAWRAEVVHPIKMGGPPEAS